MWCEQALNKIGQETHRGERRVARVAGVQLRLIVNCGVPGLQELEVVRRHVVCEDTPLIQRADALSLWLAVVGTGAICLSSAIDHHLFCRTWDALGDLFD